MLSWSGKWAFQRQWRDSHWKGHIHYQWYWSWSICSLQWSSRHPSSVLGKQLLPSKKWNNASIISSPYQVWVRYLEGGSILTKIGLGGDWERDGHPDFLFLTNQDLTVRSTTRPVPYFGQCRNAHLKFSTFFLAFLCKKIGWNWVKSGKIGENPDFSQLTSKILKNWDGLSRPVPKFGIDWNGLSRLVLKFGIVRDSLSWPDPVFEKNRDGHPDLSHPWLVLMGNTK